VSVALGHGQFRLFEADHIAALTCLFLLGLLFFRLARRGTELQKRLISQVAAATLLSYGCVIYVEMWLSGDLSWSYSLPLELCHWVLIAAFVALVRPSQIAAEIAYFWGTAGTLQATLTPDIGAGFPSWEFIQFFWSHGGILLAIVLLIGRGFRPRRGSVLRMMIAVNVYALLVGAIDGFFGWNYGYLYAKPASASVLDYLGPWPWYLAALEVFAFVSFVLLDLPWKVFSRTTRKAPTETGPPN
jgi:hypothetical integral membrane protein (TIGR02206 family)